MKAKSQKQDARPVFRLFAGVLAVPMIFLGIRYAAPEMFGFDEEQNVGMVILFLFGGFSALTIAITGNSFGKAGKQRVRLYAAAIKFNEGEITLDEYGQQTKDILNG